jgi:hypothetical protein
VGGTSLGCPVAVGVSTVAVGAGAVNPGGGYDPFGCAQAVKITIKINNAKSFLVFIGAPFMCNTPIERLLYL